MSEHEFDQDEEQEIGISGGAISEQTGASLHKALIEGHEHWRGLTPEEVAQDIKSTGEKLRADKISIEEWRAAEEKRKQVLAAYTKADLPPPDNIKTETPQPQGAEWELTDKSDEYGPDGKPWIGNESEKGQQLFAWEKEFGEQVAQGVLQQFFQANPQLHQHFLQAESQAEREDILYDIGVTLVGEHLRATSTPRKIGL